jgi:hypothetical protein
MSSEGTLQPGLSDECLMPKSITLLGLHPLFSERPEFVLQLGEICLGLLGFIDMFMYV